MLTQELKTRISSGIEILKGYLRSNECRELFMFKARAVEV